MLSDKQIDELLNQLERQTIGINVREQHRHIVQSWYAAQQSVQQTVENCNCSRPSGGHYYLCSCVHGNHRG